MKKKETKKSTDFINGLEDSKKGKTNDKKYTDLQIFNAVVACNGNVRQARLLLEMSTYIYIRLKKTPVLKRKINEYLSEKNEKMIEEAEEIREALFQQAKQGDIKAIRLYMDKYSRFFNINSFSEMNAIIKRKRAPAKESAKAEEIIGFRTIKIKEDQIDGTCPDGTPLYDLNN